MRPDVPRVEPNFMGVVAPDLTENEKIGPETRADSINAMSLIEKIWGNMLEAHEYPYLNNF